MKKIIRQVLGIDVARSELVVCFGRMYDDLSQELYAHKVFPNTKRGFSSLLIWTRKLSVEDVVVHYVMEATGVYHESLAHFLKDELVFVCIVLPSKISNYAKSLTLKTITDKSSSQAIAQFGLSHALEEWDKPLPVCKKLKQLTRERDQLVAERTVVKNHLHAEESEAEPNRSTLNRIKKRIAFLDVQIKEIVKEISQLVARDKKISDVAETLISLPGIGILTAAVVIGETSCFDLIRSKRQLVSYAGLDVRAKQSGTSVNGKPRISKQGNRYLRKVMHMAALGAIRFDERFKAIFVRLVSKHGIKMKAVVAVQRKLLEMMYVLYKTNQKYDKKYFKNNDQENRDKSTEDIKLEDGH